MGEVLRKEDQHSPSQPQPDQRRRQIRTFRLLLILPFAVMVVFLTPLVLLKKSAEVEISLQVTQVSFVISERNITELFNSVRTSSLTIQNFQGVELGPGVFEIATAVDPNTDALSAWQRIGGQAKTHITSKAEFASITFEDVTLNQVDIQQGSSMTLSWNKDEPDRLILRLDSVEATGRIAAGRTLRFSCSYCEASGGLARYDFNSKWLRFTSGREHVLTFFGRNAGMTVALTLLPGTPLVERDIHLERDVDFTQVGGRSRTSTVIGEGGKILFKELKDKEVKVSEGDFVILDDLENFFVKMLQIEDGISLVLHGRVGKLRTGPAGFVKDRLPSLFEWLYARETWVLYLNTLVLIGTTVLAILKRLKIIREEG